MAYSAAFYSLRKALQGIYEEGEARAIAREVFYETTGQSIAYRNSVLTIEQTAQIEVLREKLLTGMPLQYAIGHTTFLGRKFGVDNSVLIPRPETEELADWVIKDAAQQSIKTMLDVGTGSGCIAVSVKLGVADVSVTAIDVSDAALQIAVKNAAETNAAIDFRKLDFLNVVERNSLGTFDAIVSNPPYIPIAEKDTLAQNVIGWEPHLALFVADDDPLIFYHALAQAGKNHLSPGGKIYCELHADFGDAAAMLFSSYGYHEIELRKDLSGNTRMLRAIFS